MEFLSHKKPYRAGAQIEVLSGGESCKAGFFKKKACKVKKEVVLSY